MGKKRTNTDIDTIKTTILKYDKNEFYFNDARKFAPKNSKIWNNISDDLLNQGCSVTSLGIYSILTKNYYDVWSVLNIKEQSEASSDINAQSNSSSSCCEDPNASVETQSSFDFIITLSEDEYLALNTHEQVYRRTDKSCASSRHKSGKRGILVWDRSRWTHLMNRKIIATTALSCTFVFKGYKLTPFGAMHAKIRGFCKVCSSILNGIILDTPIPGKNVHVEFSLTGNYVMPHEDVKRRLRGYQKEQAVRKMTEQGYSASNIRNTMANDLMIVGDCEPSDLPRLGTMRTAKSIKQK